jgi:glycolate oxidase FAD binding subunit
MEPSTSDSLFVFKKQVVPQSLNDLVLILKDAEKEGLSIIPWGSGTHQRMGHPPRVSDINLVSKKLNRILEHAKEDLVVSVEAGLTLETLQGQLETSGQFFPFWAPHASKRTIGGLLATGAFNFFSGRFGELKDLVLGIQVCLSNGTLVQWGGKVVKNVSGYEMGKLYIGSMGTLGFLFSCTLRLSAIPEKRAFFETKVLDLSKGFSWLLNLFQSNVFFEGACLHVFQGKAFCFVWFSGNERIVSSQLNKVTDLLKDIPLGTWEEISFEGVEKKLAMSNEGICAFGFFPPANFPKLYSVMDDLAKETNSTIDLLFLYHGAFFAKWKKDFSLQKTSLLHLFHSLNNWVSKNGGWIAYESVPFSLWQDWPMWGAQRPEWNLSKKLKEIFDPKKILNPGRFVDKI